MSALIGAVVAVVIYVLFSIYVTKRACHKVENYLMDRALESSKEKRR